MRPRSRLRLRLAVAAAVLLLLNGLAFAFLTWPRLTRVRSAELRAQATTGRLAAVEKAWGRIVDQKNVLAQNRKDIEVLVRDHLQPKTLDLFATEREIEKLAVDAGLRPKRSSYDIDLIKGTDLVRCAVTLPLDGTYANLTAFLARIESTRRFIVVDQMALAGETEGARMNLKLSAIFKDGGDSAAR